MATAPEDVVVSWANHDHDTLIHAFHNKLQEDPLFVELLDGYSAPPTVNNEPHKGAVEFVHSCKVSPDSQFAQGIDMKSLLHAPVHVQGLKKELQSTPASELPRFLTSAKPLLDACLSDLGPPSSSPSPAAAASRTHSLEILCVLLRGIFDAAGGQEAALLQMTAVGAGEAWLRGVVSACCQNLLSAEASPFVTVLSLKLLNVLAAARGFEGGGGVLVRFLAAESAGSAAVSLLGRSVFYQHCVSLDVAVLLSALSEHSRSTAGGCGAMGDIDRPHRMLSVLKLCEALSLVSLRLLSASPPLRAPGGGQGGWFAATPRGTPKPAVQAVGDACFLNAFCSVWGAACIYHTDAVISCVEDGPVDTGCLVAFAPASISIIEKVLSGSGDDRQARVLLGACAVVFAHKGGCEAMAVKGGGGDVGLQSAVERVCSAVVAHLSSNIRMALDVGRYAASLEVLRRALIWLEFRGGAEAGSLPGLDTFSMANVCLRLVAYLGKEAVWRGPEGGTAMCSMAAQAASVINLLLCHGRPDTVRIPASAQGLAAVKNREDLGCAHLWSEVGRVHEQNEIERLLAHATVDAANKGDAELAVAAQRLVVELSLLRKVGAHVTDSISQWCVDNPNEISPTPEQILSVVCFCMPALQLDPRPDLLTPQGGGSSIKVFAGVGRELSELSRVLVDGYREEVSVLPSVGTAGSAPS